MASNKEESFKEFLISQRKKIGPGYSNVPVWIVQKKGERIWNPKQKRAWKDVGLGEAYRAMKRHEEKRLKGVAGRKRKIRVKLKGNKLGHKVKFRRVKK